MLRAAPLSPMGLPGGLPMGVDVTHIRQAVPHLRALGPHEAGDDPPTGPSQPPESPALTPAAVLLPIIDHREPTLLLTRRVDTLRKHAGQIAFPGGRVDHDDESVIAAALRETREEIGLGAERIDVAGPLADYRTNSGYRITPVVGVVEPGFTLTPHAGEVADVFEVPLGHVLDPRNHERHIGQWQGREHAFYVIHHGERRIWGVTAGIIVNFARALALHGGGR